MQSTAGLLAGCSTVLRSAYPDLSTPIDAVPPLTAQQPYGLNHVLVTGQSLATATSGAPALTTTQPYGNLMFRTGARLVPSGLSLAPIPAVGLSSLQPLVETNYTDGDRFGETICSGLANRTAARLGGSSASPMLMDVNGLSGTPYQGLKRGSIPYANGIAAVQAARSLYSTVGAASYGVPAVIAIHGEADEALANTNYAANLLEWQSNYNDDIRAITGQGATIPLQICQMSSGWEDSKGLTNIIPQQQVDAARQNPGRIILACPKYMLPYNTGNVHLINSGYRWLGEYHSRAYEYLLQGKLWQPLWPTAIAGSGTQQIVVDFHVPAAPLVFDTQQVSEPTSIPGQRYGFEVFNPGGAPVSITGAVLSGGNGTQVTLTLDRPISAGARLRYAYSRPTQNGHAGVAGPGGSYAGNRGNLRDSDGSPSLYGNALFNWCVTFDQPIA